MYKRQTEEWTGTDIKASVSPIFCPTETISPGFTCGTQAAPIFMSIGIVTFGGKGISDVCEDDVPLR